MMSPRRRTIPPEPRRHRPADLSSCAELIAEAATYPQGAETAFTTRFMLLRMALGAQQKIELIIFGSEEMAQPKSRLFDGPISLALALLIQGPTEQIPGFTSISQHGVIRRCTAYCNVNAKRGGQRVNVSATALWHIALKRQGLARGLRRTDGTIADWLAGDVVVALDGREGHSRDHAQAAQGAVSQELPARPVRRITARPCAMT